MTPGEEFQRGLVESHPELRGLLHPEERPRPDYGLWANALAYTVLIILIMLVGLSLMGAVARGLF